MNAEELFKQLAPEQAAAVNQLLIEQRTALAASYQKLAAELGPAHLAAMAAHEATIEQLANEKAALIQQHQEHMKRLDEHNLSLAQKAAEQHGAAYRELAERHTTLVEMHKTAVDQREAAVAARRQAELERDALGTKPEAKAILLSQHKHRLAQRIQQMQAELAAIEEAAPAPAQP